MNYKHLCTIMCRQGAVRKVRFNVDGMYCITCGSDKTLNLWNPHRSLFLKSYCGHGSDVMDACGSSDSSQLLSGSADRAVIMWDVPSGKVLRRVRFLDSLCPDGSRSKLGRPMVNVNALNGRYTGFRVHVSTVTCVKFNEESSLAFSGSLDNLVHIWDLKAHNFQPIQTLKDAKDSITSILVLDHEIISASLDCQIRRYDLRNGTVTTDYLGAPIVSAAMTQDGQCYIVGSDDSRLALFDKSSGELLNEYMGHRIGDYLIEVGVDHKDKTILSGSTDNSVYCWDLIGSSVLCKLQHDPNTVVHSLATHPTSAFLITATQSHVHLWGEKDLVLDDT